MPAEVNFNQFSTLDIFLQSITDYSPENLPFWELSCPFCGAKKPAWSFLGSYKRYLISFEKGMSVSNIIDIPRIVCSSCNHSHAVLPEIIIPFSSYSLLFILSVLKDHFLKMKVNDICDKYGIAEIYRLKETFPRINATLFYSKLVEDGFVNRR